MRTFIVRFYLNGHMMQEHIEALNMCNARDAVRARYAGQKLSIINVTTE